MMSDTLNDLEMQKRQQLKKRLFAVLLFMGLLVIVMMRCESSQEPDNRVSQELRPLDSKAVTSDAGQKDFGRKAIPKQNAGQATWGLALGKQLKQSALGTHTCFSEQRESVKILWRFSYQPATGLTRHHQLSSAIGDEALKDQLKECLLKTLAKTYHLSITSEDYGWHGVNYTLTHGI